MKNRCFAAAAFLALASLYSLASVSNALADPEGRARYQAKMEELSRKHGVPVSLIHRIIMRESKYAPHLTNRGHYGLMQIKLQTARGMGYRGDAAGLLDGETNMTYAVPYLANAYMAADRNETRAVQLYAGGYYYVAKRKGLLSKLHNASSSAADETPATAAAYAVPTEQKDASSPFGGFFSARGSGASPVQQAMEQEPTERTASIDADSKADAAQPKKDRHKRRAHKQHPRHSAQRAKTQETEQPPQE